MQNAGFLNLPVWHEQFQQILVDCSMEEVLRLPVLGSESFERPWSALDCEDFFSVVQTGIHFAGKKVPDSLPETIITNDPVLAIKRLHQGKAGKTFYSAAIGNTSVGKTVFTDPYACSFPEKLLVQNDAVTGYILSKMESSGKTLEEASHEAQWEKVASESPTLNLHGFVSRNRLVLQLADIFGVLVDPETIPVSGISTLESHDIAAVGQMNCSIRLLAIAEYKNDRLSAMVEPCVIPSNYLLAQARGGSEIMYVNTRNGQSHVYSCPGTSQESQVKAIFRDLVHSSEVSKERILKPVAGVEPFYDSFYIRFNMVDITTTLAQVLNIFTGAGIVVDNIHQSVLSVSRETKECNPYCVVFVTGKTGRSEVENLILQIKEQVKLATVKSCFRFLHRA